MPAKLDLCCVKKLIASALAGVLECCTFVWRPGEPAPAENVFATWPSLYAALQVAPEGFKVIAVDTSLAPALVPPGGPYNVAGSVWRALPARLPPAPGPPPYVIVEVAEGARLDNFYALDDFVTMRCLTTNAALPNLFWSGNVGVLLERTAGIVAPNGVPVGLFSGPFNAVVLNLGAFLLSPSNAPVLTVPPGSFFVLDAYAEASVSQDPVACSGGGVLIVRYSASAVVPATGSLYPSFTGSVQLTPVDRAEAVFYDDAAQQPPAAVPPAAFSFVQQFLDRIKSSAVIEQSDAYHAPAMPVSGASAQLGLAQNPMQGAVYLTQKRLLLQNLYVYGSGAPGSSARVGIYQRRGGNLGALPSEPTMQLLADVVFALPLADALITAALPTFNLESGYYCILWGLASGAGGSLLCHSAGGIELLNASAPPGKALLVFDATQDAANPLNPTFEPTAPGSLVNTMTRPLVARGG